MRAVSKPDASRLQVFFDTFPLLPTPPSLWKEATLLGQACVAAGSFSPSIDLLIAQVSLYHGAELTTFDEHFQRIAEVSRLKLNLLVRAG
ncbi:MAG TPA: PIN domain nuclease, partial [Acidobacteriota bacterium]|nr:PIN domain nuclease [Acidobacteriota bacterium]